ncbi:MAG: translocation/assembly module TamB domain-containing protein, partial [Gemmatimonadota bacterium]
MDSTNVPQEKKEPAGKRRRRWTRALLLTVVAIIGVTGIAGAFLVKTRPGQRLVLNTVLDKVRSSLAGSLTVDLVRSGNLLEGATLVGLNLEAAGGRRFLQADSVRVRYSVLSLLGARPRVSALTLYRPRVEISRYPDETEMNVARLVPPDTMVQDSIRAPGPGIVLGSVRVVDGLLDVLTPLQGRPSPRSLTVPSPDGEGRLSRIGLEGLNLELSDVVVRSGAAQLLDASLAHLDMSVAVLDRPLRVAGVEGRLTFGNDGLHIADGTFRLPGSAFDGTLALAPDDSGSWGLHLDLRTQGPASLADLSWLDDRIPDGVYRGGVALDVQSGVDVDLQDVNVELEASRLSLNGRVELGDRLVLRDLEVGASPLALSRLEPWVGKDLPLEGWLSGRMRLAGSLPALATNGRVTLVATGSDGGASTADFRGTLHLGSDPGVTDFHALVEPLNYSVLGMVVPASGLKGEGRLTVDAAGRVEEGLRFTADARQGVDSMSVSHVVLHGSVRRDESAGWTSDVQGDLSPLYLALVHTVAPSVTGTGPVSGSIRAVGPLSDLRLTGDLETAGGDVTVDATVDALSPSRRYRLESHVEGVRVSEIIGALPDPTAWSGHLQVEGSGLHPDSVDNRISLVASGSRVGGLHVDTVVARVRLVRGLIAVDTVDADLGGVRLRGTGSIGMGEGSRGAAHLAFQTDDLEGLRSLFRGDTVMARDTLNALERELLRMQGVDVDTLPTSEEVAMSGSVEGELNLSGSLALLDVEGRAEVRDGVYGTDQIGRLELSIDGKRLTSADRSAHVTVNARDVEVYGRTFDGVGADVTLEGRRGNGSIGVDRKAQERYTIRGGFALDTLGGGEVHLEEATFDLDSLAWTLARPTTVAWDSSSIRFHDFRITREGTDPMSVTAEGPLAWRGESGLHMEANGLHLDRVAHIAQLEDLGLGGHVDLVLTVTGPATGPDIEARFGVQDPRVGDLALREMSGSLTYKDRAAQIQVEARDSARQVFQASGTVPVDLSLQPRGRRVVDRPMDVHVTADSLEAAVALSYVSTLQDVNGTVSGDFQVRGTLDDPQPSGVLRLEDAAWSVEALGVRHTGIQGSLTLKEDRTMEVNLSANASGSSDVKGTVTFEPLSDPALDLSIQFQDFTALNRRDMEGNISGEVTLTGSYRKPLLQGSLTVDHGTLFLEEFTRSSGVVDLTDPSIFEVVDTASLSARPLLASIRNPFLQNLRANVDLSVPRDTWLRSEDMNVEIGGELIVTYDRQQRDLVMVGELNALRGSYSVLGRRFEVQSGTVGFVGTPGVNPTLDIQAVAHIRRMEGDPLDVTATVSGTLTQPRVTLSSDEQGIAQSDLVS